MDQYVGLDVSQEETHIWVDSMRKCNTFNK